MPEWGWDRDACVDRIRQEGLPVPIKSACWLCAAQKTTELETLPALCLRLIILVEARAAPRLRTVEGLWRSTTRARPGSMTQFIRERALLPAWEVDAIIDGAPVALIEFQRVAGDIPLAQRPTMHDWIDMFNEGVERPAA